MSSVEVDQENVTKRTTRERKQCYRDLLNKIEDIEEREDLSIQTVRELKGVLRAVNSLDDECPITERLKYADETLLDSIVLSSASNLLVKCIEAVNISKSTYDPTEFSIKIIDTIKSNEKIDDIDFIKLLSYARKIVPENPKYSFLFGTFDPKALPVQKQPKERIRKEAQEQVVKKHLQKVVNVEQEEQSVDETVSFLLKVLQEEYVKNNEKPINYYDYIIDKSSFSNTVENIFYCSFLIRDGKAKMDVDQHGNATIQPMRKRALKDFRNQEGKNTQILTSITMDEWKDFNITEGYLQRHKNIDKR